MQGISAATAVQQPPRRANGCCWSTANQSGATKEEVLETPTLKEFAPRFVDGYANANRL